LNCTFCTLNQHSFNDIEIHVTRKSYFILISVLLIVVLLLTFMGFISVELRKNGARKNFQTFLKYGLLFFLITYQIVTSKGKFNTIGYISFATLLIGLVLASMKILLGLVLFELSILTLVIALIGKLATESKDKFFSWLYFLLILSNGLAATCTIFHIPFAVLLWPFDILLMMLMLIFVLIQLNKKPTTELP
jgi:hypothetical protein